MSNIPTLAQLNSAEATIEKLDYLVFKVGIGHDALYRVVFDELEPKFDEIGLVAHRVDWEVDRQMQTSWYLRDVKELIEAMRPIITITDELEF